MAGAPSGLQPVGAAVSQGNALGSDGTPARALKGHEKRPGPDGWRPFRAATGSAAVSQGDALGWVLPALRANKPGQPAEVEQQALSPDCAQAGGRVEDTSLTRKRSNPFRHLRWRV